jgi:hypothetical protein
MSVCPCEEWIKSQPIPGKVIGFVCQQCRTTYTLYPNGEIAYEQEIGVGIPTSFIAGA